MFDDFDEDDFEFADVPVIKRPFPKLSKTDADTMPDLPYSKGEVVRFKSGSPPLTVMGHDGLQVICGWFHNGEFEVRAFDPELLYIDGRDIASR